MALDDLKNECTINAPLKSIYADAELAEAAMIGKQSVQ